MRSCHGPSHRASGSFLLRPTTQTNTHLYSGTYTVFALTDYLVTGKSGHNTIQTDNQRNDCGEVYSADDIEICSTSFGATHESTISHDL